MSLPFSNLNKQGFTLIEMMIAVGVIAIISGATMPSFAKYLETQSLEQTRQNVLSDLRSVQNRAMTGEAADQVIEGNQVAYWGIRFPGNSNSYDVFYAYNDDGCDPVINNVMDQRTQILNDDYVILDEGCLFFYMLNGDISPTVDLADGVITIEDADNSSNTAEIKFNEAGLIYAE